MPSISDERVPSLDPPSAPMPYRGPSDWTVFDEVPSWRLAQIAWANAIGVDLPDYRTKREFDEASERCARALEYCAELFSGPEQIETEFQPPEPVELPLEPAQSATGTSGTVGATYRLLPSADAAELFLNDLRALGEFGPHDDEQMRRLYAEHCARYDLKPSPENFLRGWLRQHPGVYKKQKAVNIDGKRPRKYFWMIAPTTNEARHVA